MAKDFHDRPYDAGTLAKLRIFELYAQEWIPVFLASPVPRFDEIHIFDFFCGPGTDCDGVYGSPLRILDQLRRYQKRGMAGWDKVQIVTHFFDEDEEKVEHLGDVIVAGGWAIPGVEVDRRSLEFRKAFEQFLPVLRNSRVAKLLIIDQCGVDEVSDEVFKLLISFPTTDFIFFLSSSTLHRFRHHPAIKQKIEMPDDSYDVHRATLDYFRHLIPPGETVFLGPFSIRKRSNIYGLIFGSRHPLGIHKFLQVAWANDEIAGEANFDIERANIRPDEGILALDCMRPNKVRCFEDELSEALRAGKLKSEADVIRFCIEAGMTAKHSVPVLKKLKGDGVIALDFQAPDIRKLKSPRAIRMM